MTTLIFYNDDAYEITFTPTEVLSILRFRACKDTRGELTSYDDLHPILQTKIFNVIKALLEIDRRENESNNEQRI